MVRVLRRAVAATHRWSLTPGARRFHAAARAPALAQRAIAERLVAAGRGSAYAREHGIRDLASLRAAPIVDADGMAPWWRRVESGEQGVATSEPVLMMEPSGGSTRAAKLVPYTQGLLDEFAAATAPWLADLHDRFPQARGGLAYWSISPAGARGDRTSGGVPIGLGDDTDYFGPLARWGLRRLLAVPPEVARIAEVAAWREETARRLVAARDLALLSVWSPTFLSLLMDEVERQTGETDASRLWPRLALVSCWADGPSARSVPDLRRRFPRARIQGKGLLATEGVVSFPLVGRPAPVLAVTSHFLEFLDLDREGAPLLAHELVEGRAYSPLLTTAGGLWRYHLKDVVRCVGRYHATPLVRFEGRLDHVSDLCGEKVSLGLAEQAIATAVAKLAAPPRFALLAPSLEGKPHYRLFLEAEGAPLDAIASVVDHALCGSHSYRLCRDLGQLGPVEATRVRDGLASYERALARSGQRVGAIKPLSLDTLPRWEGVFDGA